MGKGRILNIASIGGRVAVPHLAAYTASKFALVGLSESLRAELMKEGILVTTVTPGLMRTGSYVNVKLRGRHTDELKWFTAMSATPLTSMRADRAARIIVEGCRHGRATLTPGVQARLAILLNALAPNLLAVAERSRGPYAAAAAGRQYRRRPRARGDGGRSGFGEEDPAGTDAARVPPAAAGMAVGSLRVRATP